MKDIVNISEIVLGSIILEPKCIQQVYKQIEPLHFPDSKHQYIYKAILNLLNSSKPIDLITVTTELREMGRLEFVGGAYYVSTLTSKVSGTSNIDYHAKILLQNWMEKEVKMITVKTNNELDKSADIFDIVDNLISDTYNVVNSVKHDRNRETIDILDEIGEKVRMRSEGLTPGIRTNCQKYDDNAGGQQNSEIIIYAGRPGMGKSARMVNEAYFQLQSGLSVVIHSLDMPDVALMSRFIGLYLNVPVQDVTHGRISEEDFLRAKDYFVNKVKLKIFQSFKITDIIVESKMHQLMYGCDILYLDYIQQVQTGGKSDYQRVSDASLAMKMLGKEMNVPVVLLAQLSRAVEQRGGNRIPILSDLRESGQLEQDADVIEFLYRPEYYDITEDEDGNSVIGQVHYINAKFRNGDPNNVIIMNWNGPKNKISEWMDNVQPMSSMSNNERWDQDF